MNIIKLIFPPKCCLCEKIVEDENSLCLECWEKIKFIKPPFCCKCSSPLEFNISDEDICLSCIKNNPSYIKLRSAVVYDRNSARIIFKFKFFDKMHLKKFMAKCMAKSAEDILENVDILIPVPLHKKRLVMRKYNQSKLLSDELAKITKKKTIYDFLYKNAHTIPQAKLKQNERMTNLKNKFSINPKYLKDLDKYKHLNFAIVDDVVTTGSTVNECTKTLNEAGIKNVYVISFAKTVRK
jgi:ComF family protein